MFFFVSLLLFFLFFFFASFFFLSFCLSLCLSFSFFTETSRNRQSSRTKRPEHTERSQPWRDVSTFSLYFSSRSRSRITSRGFACARAMSLAPPGLFFSFFFPFSFAFCVGRRSAFSTGGGRYRAKRNVQNAVARGGSRERILRGFAMECRGEMFRWCLWRVF